MEIDRVEARPLGCFAGCEARYSIDSRITRCPDCGGLLEVFHPMEQLGTVSGEEWRNRFERRKGKGSWPWNSGVWSRREWVLDGISDEAIVSLGEGFNALIPSKRLREWADVAHLSVLECGVSHTGSFKDLGMTVLVSAVNEMRLRSSGPLAVGCASTGDTSAALAAYCAAADIPSVVILPKGKISPAQLVQPLASGARVLALDTDFDGCMGMMRQLAEAGVLYLANSMNPLRLEGQKMAALDIAQQRGWSVPDVVILPGGNLGNVYAFGKGFRMLYSLGLVDRVPRMVVAQVEAANPLFRAFQTGFERFEPVTVGETEATAIRIGDPVSYVRARMILQETKGLVVSVSEEELACAAAEGDQAGFYFDPHTGVALAGLRKLRERGDIERDTDAVVVSTAHGLKFSEHKVRFHKGEIGGKSGSSLRNQPIELPNHFDAICEVLAR